MPQQHRSLLHHSQSLCTLLVEGTSHWLCSTLSERTYWQLPISSSPYMRQKLRILENRKCLKITTQYVWSNAWGPADQDLHSCWENTRNYRLSKIWSCPWPPLRGRTRGGLQQLHSLLSLDSTELSRKLTGTTCTVHGSWREHQVMSPTSAQDLYEGLALKRATERTLSSHRWGKEGVQTLDHSKRRWDLYGRP